ncbi:MAG: xanthine dehydrogenase family protein subunit M [archaeon]|nr:xanthine dehydrogenase family protein subunit M [archaeon]
MTVEETLGILGKLGSDAKILAGGQSLIPLMKFRLAAPKYLVDINGVSSLDYIRETGNFLAIGTLTRHHTIERSELIRQKLGLFAETASWIGDPQVRNNGTIGGSLVHSDPAGDWGSSIIATRALLKVKNKKKERTLDSDHFFSDTFTSEVAPDELLTEIRVPIPPDGGRSAGAYEKLERKAGDFATVGVAVQLTLSRDRRTFEQVGIGFASLGPTNLRGKKAEEALVGKSVSTSSIEDAGLAAIEDVNPSNDALRGSAEYKRAMARVFLKRALKRAVTSAGATGV